MAGETILVVDDEPQILSVLSGYLGRDGYTIREASTVAEAVAIGRAHAPDLMILDISLPDGTGFDVFRLLSSQHPIPTIMLTARGEEIDRVVGLEMGADDYVTKPFSPREVAARVRAILRRRSAEEHDQTAAHVLRVRDLYLDREAHDVRMGGRSIALTPTEFRILAALAEHAGSVLTRAQLLDHLQDDGAIFERTLDRHITNLRKKVEPDGEHPFYVVTVYGVGYKMRRD
ncbi:MAG TPA: response regulator transcription factor [Candidatus Dormibacteraeota bacterium]|nr:response regulator transcription factor [Candidatus Dormibacteraeota bacterium]